MVNFEGIWKNLDGKISIRFINMPGESDNFKIEFVVGEKIQDGKIHLSNTDNIIYHITDFDDLIGNGFLSVVSNKEILINSGKLANLKFFKEKI
ncbi:MAG TPA: hypothetical protein DCQ26_03325 [Marinilabiliales bacterium]|nr:MAG: hypothetical protein A2W95_12430 [Bacteroidetes bacterium GWA2_40_14]OFX58929.1 MAG: hypothetical protein A2W84_11450 [Bacteroidetes bacterium GWC2_40_13]OFX71300.1 MAG: hypothetical protein A2W96_14135 [Bacteroidetes bacterium GWD2_40_43]OFX91505.1 MAG: hypothetical protein A2W97_04720 [Bacteroidetes bacterium GWE2_40_63]OFY19667.1 MAG: hypothetical protein A2W88_02610 [Bacteroidetes bacterium GWF2_40_13]OFZ25491.1 MAG: hypothetical protein A2437_13030 [Bacteroidetes bacterium RIFOXYC